jgi:hypothetical protein
MVALHLAVTFAFVRRYLPKLQSTWQRDNILRSRKQFPFMGIFMLLFSVTCGSAVLFPAFIDVSHTVALRMGWDSLC